MKIIKKLFKIFIILLLFIIGSTAFLLYGPFEKPRELWINTAMSTYTHQYLATFLFPKSTIDKVLSQNSINDKNEKVNIKSIDIKNLESLSAFNFNKSNEFDLQENSHKSDVSSNDYCNLNFISGKGFKGYLLTISDPSMVSVDVTENLNERGIKIKDYIKTKKVSAAINGGGFKDDSGHGNGGNPLGIIIKDSKIIFTEDKASYNFIGFNKDNILIAGNYSLNEIKKMNIRDGLSYFCRLIVNGKGLIEESSNNSGIQPRTAIGQTKDGKILMLVIDGRQLHSIGATLKQVQDIMLEYSAYNAVSLDGGSSSVMYYKNEIVSKPSSQYGERFLPSIFIVK
ncbi:hypothetical protein CLHOM_31050 [Clostridium homopropionicum DSM 5847]|uniref:Phosphodiester glycosidase domain-containing protein n=1 Tax=Clostridium homopropionicum DSM 5847 TaxID=1121318 RepID=A0A0L6Z5J4_9CLOT|nr:phosphodiester glycosidase family protein [Clostridium homopropionicum]KOA18227.1 hypothetical protein CLHOM_31050 [Clostridium homopropionicum DSM 5847]SFF70944.1 Exopolysaccharide biosynthesis protein [Clostridium homopropionicum]